MIVSSVSTLSPLRKGSPKEASPRLVNVLYWWILVSCQTSKKSIEIHLKYFHWKVFKIVSFPTKLKEQDPSYTLSKRTK